MVRFGSPDRARAMVAAVAVAAYVWAGATGRAQTSRPSDLPSPEQFFGFQMGADRKLANWDKLHEYYQTLARSAKNMRLVELGKSSEAVRTSRSSSPRRRTSPSSIGCAS